MQQKEIFICPLLCGCAMERTATFSISQKLLDSIDAYTNSLGGSVAIKDSLTENIKINNQYDEAVFAIRILNQCLAHSSFLNPIDLWNEIYNFHGNAHRPDTCHCSLHYWFDDRKAIIDRTYTPKEHPWKTMRCSVHTGLDTDTHYFTVLAENVNKNRIVNQIAVDLSIEPIDVPYSFDLNRNIVIDNLKLGVSQQAVDDSISKAVLVDKNTLQLKFINPKNL